MLQVSILVVLVVLAVVNAIGYFSTRDENKRTRYYIGFVVWVAAIVLYKFD